MSSQRRRTILGIASIAMAAATALVAPSAWAAPAISVAPPPAASISADGHYAAECTYLITVTGLNPRPGQQVDFVDTWPDGYRASTGVLTDDSSASYNWHATVEGTNTLSAEISGQTVATTTVSVTHGTFFTQSACATL